MKKIYISFCLIFSILQSALAQQPSDALLMQSGTLYPEKNIEEFIAGNIGESEIIDGYYYRIIQFENFPDEILKKSITDAGILLNMYLPYHSYGCAIPTSFDKSKLIRLNAHAVLPRLDAYKTERSLNNGSFPPYAIIKSGFADLVVHYQQNIIPQRAIELFEKNNFTIIGKLNAISTVTVRIKLDDFLRLTRQPFVYFVEPIPPPSTKDDTEGRSLHRSNTINSDYVTGRHYDGSGVTIGLADDGEIGPHIDFQGRVTQHLSGLGGNHGDMTSGICMGAGNLKQVYRGMATGAYLQVYDISTYPHIVNAVNNFDSLGTVITSTSYSQACNQYTANSQFGDQLIHDNPQISLCFSAGNDGTTDCSYGAGSLWGNITGGYKNGKNVIACGNLNAGDVLENSSSRGPAPDGRIKPDICSNGINQMSTDQNNTYQVGGGTSAACPGVAGVLAQLYQAYKEITSSTNPPSGLIKACVLNSAEDLGNPGPDYKHGWGRINAFRAVKCMEDHRYLADTIVQGQNKTHSIIVPNNVRQFRIMLYWNDIGGTPAATKSLVNDLDMVITDPLAAVFTPWVLNPLPNSVTLNQPAVRGTDTLNNVEQITVNNPVAGNYSISITGSQIPFGAQTYFLVYEFRTDSVYLTYPNGGEGLVPGESELIRWDAYDTTGTFDLSYSVDNGTIWTSLASSIPGADRYYGWGIQSTLTADRTLLRITRNGFSDVSDTFFTILKRPTNVHVTYECPDSIGLAWNPVANATGYVIYKLGAKYMDKVGISTGTSFDVTGTNPLSEYWFSVSAIGINGGISRRADAIKRQPGLLNCNLTVDGEITQIVTPVAGISSDCQNHSNVPVTIRITNSGANAISNIDVSYSFDGNIPVTENYSGSIASGSFFDYIFTQNIAIPSPGNYNLKTWITVNNDQNNYNDTSQINMSILSGVTSLIPFKETFDTLTLCSTASNCALVNCALGSPWMNVANGVYDDIDWIVNRGASPTAATGPTTDHTTGLALGKYIYLESSGNCYNVEADLISPCFDLTTASTAMLTFWYHMYGATMGSLHVDVIGESQVANDIIPVRSGDQGNLWKKDSINLDQFIGQSILVRFRGVTGTSFTSDMALDDIEITGLSTGINESSAGNFVNIFPNPANGIFNYFIGQGNGSRTISIRDVVGKIVFEKTLENILQQSGQIDLSFQADGVYTFSISSEKTLKQIKLLKITR